MIEQGALVFHDLVMALVEPVDLSEREVPAQQVRDGRVIKPMAVQAPLRTGIDQAVKHEGLEHLIPARALAARWQALAPEGIQPELPPQLAAQPARAPLPGSAQRHLREFEAHDGQFIQGELRRSMFFGEEGDLLRSPIILAEEIHGLAPRGFLTPVEFTQVENVPLHDALVTQATVLHDAPVEVLFAIFAPFRTTKEHDGC